MQMKQHLSWFALALVVHGMILSHSWGFENGVIPGGFNDGDPRDSRRSLEQLMAFKAAYPEVKVVYGHEL